MPAVARPGNFVIAHLRAPTTKVNVGDSEQGHEPQKAVLDIPNELSEPPQMDVKNFGESSNSPSARASEPRYFLLNELTESPRVVLDISPDLILSIPDGIAQPAVLRLMINEYGDVDHAVIENSDLPEQTQDLLLEAFEKMRFQPGQIDGQPVKSQLRIEVTLEDFDIRQIRNINSTSTSEGTVVH